MSKIQSAEKSVDQAGYVQITVASRCEVASATTAVTTALKTALRNLVLRKRSRMLVRHHSNTVQAVLAIGGDGVELGSSYPLKVGQSIDLPISPNVLSFVALSPIGGQSDVRTLEIG